LDDRTDDCACGADDVAHHPGDRFRKLRFQMIADTPNRASPAAIRRGGAMLWKYHQRGRRTLD
jgi:hypothetical protein